MQATNLKPPRLNPNWPVYPALVEVVRPYAADVGGNVYPAEVGQWAGPGGLPVLRDRVPCYLWEPNGVTLGAQWYVSRLVGNYLGLPLYATHCCGPAGSFPASSSSASGGSWAPEYPDKLVVGPPSGPDTVVGGGGGGGGVPTVTYTGTFTDTPPDSPFSATITFTGPGGPVSVPAVITGGPNNPFTYTFTGPLPVTAPGLYAVTVTVVTYTGLTVTSAPLFVTVLLGSPSSSSRSSRSSGASFGEITDTCCGCTVIPTTYRVTLDPVTDNTCVTCADYNAVNTLSYEGLGFCQWSTGDTASCGGSDPTWRLSCDGTDWILQAVGIAGQFNARYTLPVASWNCLGVNTLAFAGSDTAACNFPASATLTPV